MTEDRGDAGAATSRSLALEIDPGHGPIHGSLREGDAAPLEFVGWLGLAQALERALSEDPPRPLP
ncbi:MAG TPA: hypothetical protein VHV53_09690 [Solirubrobacterales bacterium]|jgi:hypothetical protein|nr:hypothetical protein [Solirubrobacterales bacterium]